MEVRRQCSDISGHFKKKAFVFPTVKACNIGARAANDSLIYSLRGLKQYGVMVDPDPSEQYCQDRGQDSLLNYMGWSKIKDYDVVLWVFTENYDHDMINCINFLVGGNASLKSDCDKFVTVFLDSHRVAECVPLFMRKGGSYWLSSNSLNYKDQEFSRLCEYLTGGSCSRSWLPSSSQQHHFFESGTLLSVINKLCMDRPKVYIYYLLPLQCPVVKQRRMDTI